MIKLKGSAILIALLAGTILSALLALTALSNQGIIGMVASGNDKAVAQAAARSGIEDGQLRYKKAIESGQPNQIYDISKDKIEQGNASYRLSIKATALSFGDNFSKSDWLTDSEKAVGQGALAIEENQELNIDLNYFYKYNKPKDRPTKIELKFSNLYEKKDGKLKKVSGSSEISYDLVNRSDGKSISADEFSSKENHSFSISGLSACQKENTNCILKIKSASSGITFLKIQARSSSAVIKPTAEKPGTVIIESVGRYKHSEVRLEAKYNSLGGKYLGLYNAVVD